MKVVAFSLTLVLSNSDLYTHLYSAPASFFLKIHPSGPRSDSSASRVQTPQ